MNSLYWQWANGRLNQGGSVFYSRSSREVANKVIGIYELTQIHIVIFQSIQFVIPSIGNCSTTVFTVAQSTEI